jgi:hypothetical protein
VFLVEKIATTSLRLARLLEHAQKMFGWRAPFESRSADRIGRYETMLDRFFNNAVEQLERAQQIRKATSNGTEASDEEPEFTANELQEMTEDQTVHPEDAAADEPAQVRTSLSTSEINPPAGPTEDEVFETLDLEPHQTQNYETNPPQPHAVEQFTDDEPPTHDSDYDEGNDWHPRQTAEDLLDGPDRIKKEH